MFSYKNIFLSFFKNKAFDGELEIVADNKTYLFGKKGKIKVSFVITNNNFFRQVILYGDIGFGESYFMGYFQTDNLKELLTWFLLNSKLLPGFPEKTTPFYSFEWAKLLSQILHLFRKNTKKGSKKNIEKHYDISNEFYKLCLDPTLTYSCGIFEDKMNLEQAQENKYKIICEKLKIQESDHLLEIGSGWGGFSIYVAKNYNCKITTITISDQQYIYAKSKIKNEALDDKIEIKLQDYRDVKGKYDKIVSIEMMEALGYEYVPSFIDKCNNLLNKGGKICYQCIVFPDKYFKNYLKSQDFIKKHIFPGAELLSIAQIKNSLQNIDLFELINIQYLGKNYSKTLNCWAKNFLESKKEIFDLGFDEMFFKKRYYYFVSCEVGFENDYLDVAQILIEKSKN